MKGEFCPYTEKVVFCQEGECTGCYLYQVYISEAHDEGLRPVQEDIC
jgi:hypothetical protein